MYWPPCYSAFHNIVTISLLRYDNDGCLFNLRYLQAFSKTLGEHIFELQYPDSTALISKSPLATPWMMPTVVLVSWLIPSKTISRSKLQLYTRDVFRWEMQNPGMWACSHISALCLLTITIYVGKLDLPLLHFDGFPNVTFWAGISLLRLQSSSKNTMFRGC